MRIQYIQFTWAIWTSWESFACSRKKFK